MDKLDSLENLRIFRSIHDMIKFSIELITMREFVTNHPNYYTPLEQEYYKEIIDENIVKVKKLIENKNKSRKKTN